MIPRRAFLRGVSGAGTVALLGLRGARAADEPPPETSRLRLLKTTTMCWAPQFVAEELLKTEGFTDVSYRDTDRDAGLAVPLS